MQPNDDLEQAYNDLTETQKAIIDAHAEHPDETNREKCKIAGEQIGKEINESYCSQVLNKKYPKVAQYREEIVQNERTEGSMTTEGNPFKGIPQDDSGFQSIQERPVKQTQPQSQESTSQPVQDSVDVSSPVEVKAAQDGVYVKFDYRYLRELLEDQENQLPPELHARLVDVVLDRAFRQEPATS